MEEKTYFQPGMIVTLRQNIPNKPTMVVVGKVTSIFKHKDSEESALRGIKCRWFTTDGLLQEEIFNTKDLLILN